MNTIQYKGKIYIFPPKSSDDTYPDKINNDRLWFIVKNIDKGSFEHITNMSYIWMMNKFYNLEYDHHIMSELSEYTS